MGILDYLPGANQPWMRSPVDQGIGYGLPGGPQRPQQGGGILDFDQSQGRQPLSDEQRRSILFSAIADSFDSVRGINSDTTGQLSQQFRQDNTKQQSDKRRQAVNQAISTAYAQAQQTGDYTPVRQALMAADAAGEDVSHITQHLQFGQPKIQDIGGVGYQIDPLGMAPPKAVIPSNAPPKTRNYQSGGNEITEEWDPVTRTFKRLGIGPKFSPGQARAPNPNAPVNLGPHPSAGY